MTSLWFMLTYNKTVFYRFFSAVFSLVLNVKYFLKVLQCIEIGKLAVSLWIKVTHHNILMCSK